jgi:hypothetical protein
MLTQAGGLFNQELQNPQRGSQRAWVWPIRTPPAELIAKNEHLADVLVNHFRTVSKGYVPFTLDWDQKQVVQMAGSEKEAVDYMKMMSQEVPKSGMYFLLSCKERASWILTGN